MNCPEKQQDLNAQYWDVVDCLAECILESVTSGQYDDAKPNHPDLQVLQPMGKAS